MALQRTLVAAYFGGLATVTIEWDDAAMAMTQGIIANGTAKPVTLILRDGKNNRQLYSVTAQPGQTINQPIPGSQPVVITNGVPDFGDYLIETRYG